MERKLASIQLIDKIEPIPGADAIDVATVLGWKVVVRKNDFEPGDMCVYVEVDSVLPEREEFEFLRKGCWVDKHGFKGFRIRTVRLLKQLSQGICFPTSILPGVELYRVGDDVTDVIGIVKYDPPLPAQLHGKVKRRFPGTVRKTDEFRVQSYPDVIEEFDSELVYVSTKVDGTSGTFINYDGETDVCSRNLSLIEDYDNSFWQVFRKYEMNRIFEKCPNIAIQGEVAGPGIQKNPLGLKEIDLFVFQVYDIKAGKYLDYNDFIEFCDEHKLRTVPIERENVKFDWDLPELLEMAKGHYDLGKDKEGIVIRPMVEKYSNVLGGRLSIKVLNNDMLLEKDGD